MKQRLYRSREERKLGGVLAGFADYVGLDPVIWRIAFLVSVVLTSGAMLLVYLLAWYMIPTRPTIMPLDPRDYTVLKD